MFPAYAGMIRRRTTFRPRTRRVPRLRGDDPLQECSGVMAPRCSPPTRG